MKRRSHFSILLGLFLVPAISQATRADVAEWSTPLLYERACSPCHGATGAGVSPEDPFYQTFQVPPADLTDPLFNSREPRADWFQVVKHGGLPMGLSSQMPAFSGAFDDQQIEDLVEHLKTLVDTGGYPPGELNFLRAIDTIKAFPEDEALLLQRYENREGAPDATQTVAYLARRLGRRAQWEAKLAHVDDGIDSQLDEIELGLKLALLDDLSRQWLLSGGVELALPLNGDDSEQVIPYFSMAKGLSDALTLQGTLRSHLPTEDLAKGDAKISAVVHWMQSPWPRSLSPALEVTGTLPFEGEQRGLTLIPQLYAGLSRRGHVALTLGLELPLADEDYDYRLRGFLLWDLADGMFWEGW